jgi:hypothetical protein
LLLQKNSDVARFESRSPELFRSNYVDSMKNTNTTYLLGMGGGWHNWLDCWEFAQKFSTKIDRGEWTFFTITQNNQFIQLVVGNYIHNGLCIR